MLVWLVEASMARDRRFARRAPRIDVRLPAVLVNSDGVESKVMILDVSSGGFCLEIEESPRVGEFVTLRDGRGDAVPAQIRWTLGNEAGGVFLVPVDTPDWKLPHKES
jgi:hypothetical protein